MKYTALTIPDERKYNIEIRDGDKILWILTNLDNDFILTPGIARIYKQRFYICHNNYCLNGTTPKDGILHNNKYSWEIQGSKHFILNKELYNVYYKLFKKLKNG